MKTLLLRHQRIYDSASIDKEPKDAARILAYELLRLERAENNLKTLPDLPNLSDHKDSLTEWIDDQKLHVANLVSNAWASKSAKEFFKELSVIALREHSIKDTDKVRDSLDRALAFYERYVNGSNEDSLIQGLADGKVSWRVLRYVITGPLFYLNETDIIPVYPHWEDTQNSHHQTFRALVQGHLSKIGFSLDT